jgi:D-alanyl-D-alanine carboxypeptidase/D-alanyl-D-alanine-endopeptidase (penicillin-binding protein 4)
MVFDERQRATSSGLIISLVLKKNMGQTSTFVKSLKGMDGDPSQAIFRRSPAVAGVSGTLRNRFRNPAVQGKVHA